MMNNEERERIKSILCKDAKSWTNNDKSFLNSLFKKGCRKEIQKMRDSK